jgi:cytoskeletal protein RodZ
VNHGGKKLSEVEFLATTRTNKEKSMGMFFERRCPYCRAIISDYANKCPRCGEWLISESEKKQLDRNIQENKKLKQQAEGFIALCIIAVFIILAIFVAIDGIKNTFFDTSKTESAEENVIEQKGDVINTDEEDYNRFVKENQEKEQASKPIQQPVQTQQQSVSQPQKQIQQVSKQNNVVIPQAKPLQTQQQNQDIDDFMN